MILTLKNSHLEITVRPDLGGRIDRLHHLQTQQDWLWHPVDYESETHKRSLPIGAPFDSNWTGGWDEIFPNDAAGEFQGRQLVDHGELWSQAWQVADSSETRIKLVLNCQTVPVTVTKSIALHPTEPQFRIDYELQNHSDETIPFLLKQHCAIAIEEGDEILLPDCAIEPVALGFSKIIGQEGKTRFPKAIGADGQEVDLRFAPSRSSGLQEFYYSFDLAKGECGIRRARTGSTLKMQFEQFDFPYVWVFQSYGGWQNHYVLVMEPCTTMPYDLEVASQNGTIAQLAPNATHHLALTVELS